MLEYKFYSDKPSEQAESKAKAKEEKKPAAAFDPFADMMGGDSDSDDVDLMDFNPSAPPKKKEEKKKEPDALPVQEAEEVVEGDNRYVLSLKRQFKRCSEVL